MKRRTYLIFVAALIVAGVLAPTSSAQADTPPRGGDVVDVTCYKGACVDPIFGERFTCNPMEGREGTSSKCASILTGSTYGCKIEQAYWSTGAFRHFCVEDNPRANANADKSADVDLDDLYEDDGVLLYYDLDDLDDLDDDWDRKDWDDHNRDDHHDDREGPVHFID